MNEKVFFNLHYLKDELERKNIESIKSISIPNTRQVAKDLDSLFDEEFFQATPEAQIKIISKKFELDDVLLQDNLDLLVQKYIRSGDSAQLELKLQSYYYKKLAEQFEKICQEGKLTFIHFEDILLILNILFSYYFHLFNSLAKLSLLYGSAMQIKFHDKYKIMITKYSSLIIKAKQKITTQYMLISLQMISYRNIK